MFTYPPQLHTFYTCAYLIIHSFVEMLKYFNHFCHILSQFLLYYSLLMFTKHLIKVTFGQSNGVHYSVPMVIEVKLLPVKWYGVHMVCISMVLQLCMRKTTFTIYLVKKATVANSFLGLQKKPL